MDKIVNFILGLVGLMVLLVVGFFSAIYGAFVFSEIYSWFLQPVTGYELNMLFFYGVLVFIGLFKYTHPKTKGADGKPKPFGEQFVESFGAIITLVLYYSFTWGLGYLAFVLLS